MLLGASLAFYLKALIVWKHCGTQSRLWCTFYRYHTEESILYPINISWIVLPRFLALPSYITYY